jgi:hypothetical protein
MSSFAFDDSFADRPKLKRRFLMARKIDDTFLSYEEYPAKSVVKEESEFLIAALVKSQQDPFWEV